MSIQGSGYSGLDRWLFDQGSEISGAEEDLYERQIVEEARMIVAGTTMILASREHLRILLLWLDGCASAGGGNGKCVDYDLPPF